MSIPGQIIYDWMQWFNTSYDAYAKELEEYDNKLADWEEYNYLDWENRPEIKVERPDQKPIKPVEYTGWVPDSSSIVRGLGQITAGLMTVSGGGRSYGVLGEGNKVDYDNGTLKYDVNHYSVRRQR